MARNEEKAMAMLNRWVRAKRELGKKKPVSDQERALQRPDDPSTVNSVQEADIWRTNIVREISKKVSDIQNGSLAEFKIRELNDSINELIQAKDQWEARILSLGGRDYKADALERFGNEVNFNTTGEYQYFGAAKNLVVEDLIAKPEKTW